MEMRTSDFWVVTSGETDMTKLIRRFLLLFVAKYARNETFTALFFVLTSRRRGSKENEQSVIFLGTSRQ
jgi:hypothetical protein